MTENKKITWLGHSCFKIEYRGYSIVIDPYTGVPGLPELHCSADAVYASHGHDDHSWVKAVQLSKMQKEKTITAETVDCWHDEKHGALRGENKITVFSAGGKRIAHFGDIGHQLSPEQIKAVGHCDIAMLPIGGYYTIDAEGAKAIAAAVDAHIIVPMHYRSEKFGYDVIATLDIFLSLMAESRIVRLKGPSFDVLSAEKQASAADENADAKSLMVLDEKDNREFLIKNNEKCIIVPVFEESNK